LKLPTTDGIDLAGVNARMQTHGYSSLMQGDTLVLKQERRP
jgi:hypothetical protein